MNDARAPVPPELGPVIDALAGLLLDAAEKRLVTNAAPQAEQPTPTPIRLQTTQRTSP